MTQTLKFLTVILLTVAAGILLGAGYAAAVAEPVRTTAPAEVRRIDAIPAIQGADLEVVEAALGAGSDFTGDQAQEILLGADRICEGFTADVPVVALVDELVWNQGMTGEAARDFVNWVGVNRCYPAA